MDFKNKITEHKLFDYFILSILAYYTIFITPINIIFIVLTTKAYLVNNENLLNCFILELVGFLCLTQLYLIKSYNKIVATKEFKKLYIKAENLFPILKNYDPEMLFIELLCSDNNVVIDNNIVEENSNSMEISVDGKEIPVDGKEIPIDGKEIPVESDSKKMKKLFMTEMLKNPALISNMTKMVGTIDPNILKTFSREMSGNK